MILPGFYDHIQLSSLCSVTYPQSDTGDCAYSDVLHNSGCPNIGTCRITSHFEPELKVY